MATSPATFFVARVSKLGELTTERLQEVLASPLRLPQSKHVFSIVDTEPGTVPETSGEVPYLYGRLVKFAPEGEVTVVNTDLGTSEKKPEPNLELAGSRFVFIPDLMLLAYENVWHHFEYKQFPKILERLLANQLGGFFAEVEIKVISDLLTFIQAIEQLQQVHLIRAKVRPPNPLFGDLWKNLADYLSRRDTAELTVNEKSDNYGSLATELKTRLKPVSKDEIGERRPLEITDAAVAMAADGYGEAKVEGKTAAGDRRVVRTRDSALSFTVHQDATIPELAAKTLREAVRVNNERNLQH